MKQFLKKYNILYVGGFPRSTNPRLSTPLHFSAVGECSARRISRGLKREKGWQGLYLDLYLYICGCICICIYVCICICVIRGLTAHWGKEVVSLARGGQCSFFLSMQCFPFTSFFSLIFEKVAQHRANDEYKDRPPLVQADGRRAEHGREGKVASN